MDELGPVIRSFTEQEQKEFRRFIQRKRYKNVRKDLELFDYIVQLDPGQKADGFTSLYNSSTGRNAYHSLRKRLVRHLHDFIYLKRTENDSSRQSEIAKNIMLATAFFEQQLEPLAWKYLTRAGQLAEKGDLNQQLVLIYDLQLTHYNQDHVGQSIDKLIAKRLKAGRFAEEEERLRIIGSLVRQELEKVKLEGRETDLQRIIDRLFARFNMDDSVFNRPRLLYDFVMLTRSVVLAKKTFYSFETFLLNAYDRIQRSGFFETRQMEYLSMLYIVSHTLYRNRKFRQAIDFLGMMSTQLTVMNKGLSGQFEAKYYLLLAACTNFSGQLQESVDILESLLQKGIKSTVDSLNAKLNLAICYFQLKEYRRAHRTLINLGHTDRWCEKSMGVEWLLKKNLVEVCFLYELGKPEIAYDRVVYLERTYKDLFRTKKYERVAIFLKLVRQIIDQPADVHSVAFLDQVENSFEWISIEEEDLQAMSYYAWLKAKMQKRDFYEVMLQLMNQQSPDQPEIPKKR